MMNVPICEKEALLLTDRKTRKYFAKEDVAEGFLVVTENQTVCFTDARYFSAIKDRFQSAGVQAKLFTGLESIKECLVSLGVRDLYIDFTKETIADYQKYKELGFNLRNGFDIIKTLRSKKSDDELNHIKKACEIAEKAYHTAIKEIKKGITENELKDRLENLMISFGAEGVSFETIVAFGANSAVPHHQTGDTVLADNTVVLVDMGCTVNGYCSDITRTAFFGTPDKEFLDCYQAVLAANVMAEEKIYSGVSGKEADAFARDFLKEKGLDKYFTHSLGHGIGLDIHEYLALSPKSSDILTDGMVFSVEPGVYFDGEFGIRIEDTVTLNNGKVERLFTDDKKLILLK
ncbi:MAG: aminopeptidase P family protein [Clostridia bacterium]|nr:aminopeptidase P family protein [Clostridia bacterium]